MLHEVEEGVKAAREFLRRVSTLQSDHALRHLCENLEDMEDAGYADVQAVRDFREEVKDSNSFPSSGPPHEIGTRGEEAIHPFHA